tara:strand:+ start:1102 stop:1353 length:252 start_codon:yes stop_codon:yes gene_type:complete
VYSSLNENRFYNNRPSQKCRRKHKIFKFFSDSFDLFICTSKEHEKDLEMFNDIKDYFLVEEDIKEKATQNFLLNLKEVSKILQ